MDGGQTGTTVRAIVRMRWLGMALGLTQAALATPAPVSRAAVAAICLTVAVYNALIVLALRRGVRPATLAVGALGLDFLAIGAGVMLMANDEFSTAYTMLMLAGIEAAVLFQRRGVAGFAAATVPYYAALYWERAHFFGFAVEPGSLVFRAGIVLLVTLFVAVIAGQSNRRRGELERQAVALRESEERFRQIFDTTSIGMSVVDGRGRVVSANRAYQHLVGYTEAELTTMRIADFTHPDDVGADIRLAAEVASGVRSHGQVEKRWVRKDGEVRWVRVNASHLAAPDGGQVIAIVEDISERKSAESHLHRSSRLQAMQFAVSQCLAEAPGLAAAAPCVLAGLVEALDWDVARLLVAEPEGELTVVHEWRRPELGPRPHRPVLDALAGAVVSGGRTVAIEGAVAFPILQLGRVAGVVAVAGDRPMPIESDLLDVLADIGRQIGQFVERTEVEAALSETAARLAAVAATDALTGLANRREFERLLTVPRPRGFAILAIDVDNLKVVNDTYGHEAGDGALRAISVALRMGLRDGDIVARTGGDEFAALLPGTDLGEAARIADRLRRAMHGVALPHGQARISIGCAAGAAGADPQRVLGLADEALYRAKGNGRDRIEADAEDETAAHRVRWETLVPSLLRTDGMTSVFQPIVRLPEGDVVAYEALGRPNGSPADVGVEALFAAADRIGEGRSLDWLCRRAALVGCRDLPESALLFINVGVSVLLDPLHDVDQMLLLLRWAGRSPEHVVLEITERESVRDMDRLRVVVAEYRRHGFRFALDDVGTGHSTFEVLSVVTPEFIKVAGRLTRRSEETGPRAAIRALVAFARSSGARVIAEEVETGQIAMAMCSLGVDLAQGFMWGAPAAADTWR